MNESDKTSNLIGHLAELRKHLIVILFVNLAATLVCYQYIGSLIQILLRLNPGMELIYISPSELFMVYVRLALICAIIFCMPVTIMQIWSFISPGLTAKERFYGIISLCSGLICFALGTVFCYLTALPITLQFFLRITLDGVAPMISIENYISFVTTLLGCFGAAFELPVVIYLLSELGIVKPALLKRAHGVLILVIFVVAAIITPPDVITQIILGLPMTLLLEFSIWICIVVDKRKQRQGKMG